MSKRLIGGLAVVMFPIFIMCVCDRFMGWLQTHYPAIFTVVFIGATIGLVAWWIWGRPIVIEWYREMK